MSQKPMTPKNNTPKNNTIDQMVQSVLKDILCSIVEEFEQKTGVRVGSVRIGPARDQDARTTEIEIVSADSDALIGLMQYKKILCDHELIKDSDFCMNG